MEIRPFKGWRYCAGERQDIGQFVAPPYDILSAADKQQLLAQSAENIVAVDLPHVPPKEVGPDSVYQQAAALLDKWKHTGVLCQDAPSVYVYQQVFDLGPNSYRRLALLCGVRATPLGEDVIPHEHTFDGPKADRLKLTEYTKTQLSPIFGFYRDAGVLPGLLQEISERPTPIQARLEAPGQRSVITEKLWVVSDEATIKRMSQALANVPVFIADGHHRYTTAMNYRDQLKAAGRIDNNHESNFVLFALVHRDDPGLIILPTHRIVQGLVGGFDINKLVQAATEFTWKRVSLEGLNVMDIDKALHVHGPHAMALIGAKSDDCWIATLTDTKPMEQAAPDQLPAWRDLSVSILHKLIIDKDLVPWKTDQMTIDYTPDAANVVAACKAGRAQLGICLQSTPLSAVEEIARSGAVMPHKSTYFYPKLTTGMVLKPME